jgi:putative membrane protein
LWAVAAVVAAVTACGGDAPEAELAADSAEVAGAVPAAPATPKLGDAEIAHVAVTANTIDAELGRLAQTKSQNEAVLAFAQTMIADHTAVNEQAAQLAQSLSLTPADNAVSQQLQDGAAAARTGLEGLSGAAFDQAYVQREVEYHQAVLDALDGVLIPGAQNTQLRELLQNVRPAFDAHLQRARQLQGTLGG